MSVASAGTEGSGSVSGICFPLLAHCLLLQIVCALRPVLPPTYLGKRFTTSVCSTVHLAQFLVVAIPVVNRANFALRQAHSEGLLKGAFVLDYRTVRLGYYAGLADHNVVHHVREMRVSSTHGAVEKYGDREYLRFSQT
jgi:hypothetical protein